MSDTETLPDGSKIRDVKRIGTTRDGHIAEVYNQWNHIDGTTSGGRVRDGKSGATLMVTEGHESRDRAARWLKIALGLAVIAMIVTGG